MKVISDTGPLSALGKLERLDLIGKLYGEILIASEVQDEIKAGVRLNYKHCYLLVKLIQQGQLRVIEPIESEPTFQRPIDLGEIATIRLALQEKADLVLIDDRDGRKEAARLGIAIKGTVGIVLDAFERGSLSAREAEKLLRTVGNRRDIWISKKITEVKIKTIRKRRK